MCTTVGATSIVPAPRFSLGETLFRHCDAIALIIVLIIFLTFLLL